MSARRIIRRNAQILKKSRLTKQLEQATIRIYSHHTALEMMTTPSQLTPIYSNPSIINNIFKLRRLAANKKLVYLTDIQYEEFFRFFVVHKRPQTDVWIHEDYSNEKDFNIFINPQIVKYEGQPTQVIQECHSFPFIKSTVDRFAKIVINYQKIKNQEEAAAQQKPQYEEVSQTYEGFPSILIQHCMDHLQGRHFFTPQVSKGRLQFNYHDNFFKNTRFLIREYNLRMKIGLEQNKTTTPQYKKMQESYQERLKKSFTQEASIAETHSKNFKNIF